MVSMDLLWNTGHWIQDQGKHQQISYSSSDWAKFFNNKLQLIWVDFHSVDLINAAIAIKCKKWTEERGWSGHKPNSRICVSLLKTISLNGKSHVCTRMNTRTICVEHTRLSKILNLFGRKLCVYEISTSLYPIKYLSFQCGKHLSQCCKMGGRRKPQAADFISISMAMAIQLSSLCTQNNLQTLNLP